MLFPMRANSTLLNSLLVEWAGDSPLIGNSGSLPERISGHFPKYSDLLKKGSLKLNTLSYEPFQRPPFESLGNPKFHEKYIADGYIGEDTEPVYYPFIISFIPFALLKAQIFNESSHVPFSMVI